jgi:hypothetical protein
MATYYGYVEREADSFVNWADVGRQMATTIDTIHKEREDKKALIEKAYREDLDYIMENPSGENESLNKWSLNYGHSAAENLKLKNQLFKQGKLSLKDYLSFRQNITDDTENLYGTIGKMQEIYKDKMDRYKNGDSQALETFNMQLLEQFGNLPETDSYINPLTGAVTLALYEEVEENGKKVRRMSKDPNKLLTVSQLKAMANVKYDNYNPIGDVEAWVKSNGEVLDAIQKIGSETQVGTITDMKDVTWDVILTEYKRQERPQEEIDRAQIMFDRFKKAETDFAKTLTANPYKELAILTDQKKFAPNGKQYALTYNPEEAKSDPSFILIERGPDGASKPVLTPDQKEDAVQHIRNLAYPMYDKTRKIQTYQESRKERIQPRAETEGEREGRLDKETVKSNARWIGMLHGGTMEQKQQAMSTLRTEPGVADARFVNENGKVYVEIISGGENAGKTSKVQLTNSDGSPYSSVTDMGKAIASAIYTSPENRKVIGAYEKEFNDALNSQWSNFQPFDMNKKDDQYWSARQEVTTIKTPTKFASVKQGQAAQSVQAHLDEIGLEDYTVKPIGTLQNWISIIGPDKKEVGRVQVSWPEGSAEASTAVDVLSGIIKKIKSKNSGAPTGAPKPTGR